MSLAFAKGDEDLARQMGVKLVRADDLRTEVEAISGNLVDANLTPQVIARLEKLGVSVATDEDMIALADRLRDHARGYEAASKLMANAKTARQGDGRGPDDPMGYMWTRAEQTDYWRAADILDAITRPTGITPNRERDKPVITPKLAFAVVCYSLRLDWERPLVNRIKTIQPEDDPDWRGGKPDQRIINLITEEFLSRSSWNNYQIEVLGLDLTSEAALLRIEGEKEVVALVLNHLSAQSPAFMMVER